MAHLPATVPDSRAFTLRLMTSRFGLVNVGIVGTDSGRAGVVKVALFTKCFEVTTHGPTLWRSLSAPSSPCHYHPDMIRIPTSEYRGWRVTDETEATFNLAARSRRT